MCLKLSMSRMMAETLPSGGTVRAQASVACSKKPRRLHKLVGSENRNHPAAVSRGAHQVGDFERLLAEEVCGALLLEDKK